MAFLQRDLLVRVFEVNAYYFHFHMLVYACLCFNADSGAAVLHSPLTGAHRPQVPF